MWFAVSCMPSSNSSLGGILTRGRQKCDVTQAAQTCAFDALHNAEEDNVVLKDYRKLAAARNSFGDFCVETESFHRLHSSDISPDFPERTNNSSTSSSGYHSGRELPHSNSTTVQNVANSYPEVDFEESQRLNKAFDENILRRESIRILRREKSYQNFKDGNGYHGDPDVSGDCLRSVNRNSYHGNIDLPSSLRSDVRWENNQNRVKTNDRLHHSKSFSDFRKGIHIKAKLAETVRNIMIDQ